MSKENFIYNFSYYFNQGLLNYSEVMADLFYTGGRGLQYLYKIGQLNEEYDDISNDYQSAVALRSSLKPQQILYTQAISSAEAEIIKYDDLLYLASNGYRYSDLITGRFNDLLTNDAIKSYVISITTLKTQKEYHESLLASINASLTDVEESLKTYEESMKDKASQKVILNSTFFRKYAYFIKEGTWNSEEYTDDELYYLDAMSVGNTSAFPQISYNFQLTSLQGLEDFENYKFSVGEKTYVEDTEFFGYVFRGGYKTPYREEVIISEITYTLDNPSADSITIKNFKTQFEDLFKKISSTVQSVQLNSGSYQRAASIVSPDGTIDIDVLRKSLAKKYFVSILRRPTVCCY